MILGMTYYEICMYFLMYSFLGWCVEVVYHALVVGKIVNRGFLNGPVCPVYGFGMLAVCSMIHFIPKNAVTGEVNVLGVFFGGMILATAVEFVAGYLLYHLFHARWWDYSDKPLNIGGYICPLYSVLWGIGCVIVVKYVHPLVQSASDVGIPEKYGWPIMLVLYIIYFIDLIATVLTVAGLNRKLKELDGLDKSLRTVSDHLSEAIGGTTLKTSEKVGEARVQGALAKAQLADAAGEAYEKSQIRRREKKAERLEKREETQRLYQEAAAESRQKVEETKALLLEKRDAILAQLSSHRAFGAERLFRAFPDMHHRDYGETMDRLRNYLSERREKRDRG
ncbi:MAG: hypothetical protein PUE63_00520 [Lachnospiraceae bacterium]|nr:hypothetical protein [Lachnospiraceae bacterium]